MHSVALILNRTGAFGRKATDRYSEYGRSIRLGFSQGYIAWFSSCRGIVIPNVHFHHEYDA